MDLSWFRRYNRQTTLECQQSPCFVIIQSITTILKLNMDTKNRRIADPYFTFLSLKSICNLVYKRGYVKHTITDQIECWTHSTSFQYFEKVQRFKCFVHQAGLSHGLVSRIEITVYHLMHKKMPHPRRVWKSFLAAVEQTSVDDFTRIRRS
ncbi:hypothetical protein pipiens_009205 [Culex pipiens pipiens]|uniref:Uncharacterized protein n=1 Tax=Culex pipiens pipiens TaxID=38569 RepID=A0ABD1DEY8_CULPP